MKINERILEILKEFNIYPPNGICYLISLYYGYEPTYIPEGLKIKINITGIITEKNKNLHWNIPLYEQQVTEF